MSFSLASLPAAAYGFRKKNPALAGFWKPALWLASIGLTASLVILGFSFLTNDFSVAYVANHSNTQLEPFYKIAAIWGSHQGSMLLWIWMIAVWGLFGCGFGKAEGEDKAKAFTGASLLGIVGLLTLFLLCTSHPFERLLPLVPPEGKDLNPILQDIGMIFHPPLLFLGYAGLSYCYCLGMAFLTEDEITKGQWTKLLLSSCVTWFFLTGGNVLGSWWAYTELGWGGWWFWDPVENSSFVPWLLITGVIHSVLLSKWKKELVGTSLFLVICAFASCLLGSFIVRSGIIQSVHAFASAPGRGLFLLLVSLLILVPGFCLFALRIQKFTQKEEGPQSPADMLTTLGIWLLGAAAFSVIVGTLYPLFYETLGAGTLSVGAPYFNTIFAPMAILAAILIGVVQFLGSRKAVWVSALAGSAVLSAGIAFLTPCADRVMTLGGTFALFWLASSCVFYLTKKDFKVFAFCAHLGIAVSMAGVVGDTQYQQEALVRMGPGQGRPLGDVIFVYDETKKVDAKSYYADEGQVYVLDKNENEIDLLKPQRQIFKNNGMEMTAAGISHGFLRDLYVSMGNRLSADEFLVRLSIKPLVSWIWMGGLIMMLGAVLGCMGRIFRRRRSVEQGA